MTELNFLTQTGIQQQMQVVTFPTVGEISLTNKEVKDNLEVNMLKEIKAALEAGRVADDAAAVNKAITDVIDKTEYSSLAKTESVTTLQAEVETNKKFAEKTGKPQAKSDAGEILEIINPDLEKKEAEHNKTQKALKTKTVTETKDAVTNYFDSLKEEVQAASKTSSGAQKTDRALQTTVLKTLGKEDELTGRGSFDKDNLPNPRKADLSKVQEGVKKEVLAQLRAIYEVADRRDNLSIADYNTALDTAKTNILTALNTCEVNGQKVDVTPPAPAAKHNIDGIRDYGDALNARIIDLDNVEQINGILEQLRNIRDGQKTELKIVIPETKTAAASEIKMNLNSADATFIGRVTSLGANGKKNANEVLNLLQCYVVIADANKNTGDKSDARILLEGIIAKGNSEYIGSALSPDVLEEAKRVKKGKGTGIQ